MSDALAGARRDYDRLQELSRLLRIVRGAAPGAPQVNAIGAISPDVASQIKALDVLIAGQTNATVRAQLDTIRNEFIDRTIADASEGAARAIDGFQEGEDRLRRLGATPNDEVLSNGGFELNLSRRLRTGLNFTPFFNGRVEGDNYKGKPNGEDDGGKGLEDLYTFRAGRDDRGAVRARARRVGDRGVRARRRARERGGPLRSAIPAWRRSSTTRWRATGSCAPRWDRATRSRRRWSGRRASSS